MPLSEQNDQVHVGGTLADSEQEAKGRFDFLTDAETDDMQGVSLKSNRIKEDDSQFQLHLKDC